MAGWLQQDQRAIPSGMAGPEKSGHWQEFIVLAGHSAFSQAISED
jgi:hypothetical protein